MPLLTDACQPKTEREVCAWSRTAIDSHFDVDPCGQLACSALDGGANHINDLIERIGENGFEELSFPDQALHEWARILLVFSEQPPIAGSEEAQVRGRSWR